jgi:hypothetical protein
MSRANTSETAPTQFQDIGDVRLAFRRFGKEGAPPVVCLQHFAWLAGMINHQSIQEGPTTLLRHECLFCAIVSPGKTARY